MVIENTQSTNDRSNRGHAVDKKVIQKAVNKILKARESGKIGTVKEVAEELHIHPITVSKWVNDPRYNKTLKAKKDKTKVKTETYQPKKYTKKKEVNPSLQTAIAGIPSNYDDLYWEHIQLLREKYQKKK